MFDFCAFPVIETARLKLRCLCAKDAAAIFAVRSDFEVTKYNSGAAYTEEVQALALIHRSINGLLSKGSLYWALVMKDTDEVVGQMGFNCWDRENHSAEVGFDLRRDMWGKGIMKEALQGMLLFGWQHMNLNRIGARVSAYNVNCTGLLTRLGFQHEGTMREQYYEDGKYHDLLLFAMLRRECFQEMWRARGDVTFIALPAAPDGASYMNT